MALPIENLLRKPAELYTSAACTGGAALLLSSPQMLYFSPLSSLIGASVLLAFGAIRFRQGWRLVRYQRGLRILPSFQMSGDEVPVSQEHLFIGKGFRWDKRHTARLLQLLEPQYIGLTRASWLMNQAFRLDKFLEQRGFSPKMPIRRLMALNHPLNPVRPMPKIGGSPAIHAVGLWEGETNQWMDLGERVGHMLVLGTTRVGKTRAAEILITQDIARGNVVIVFDPKGDAELLKRIYVECKRAGRLEQLRIFHLGRPDISARYNPIDSFDRITEVATRIANQLPGEGQSAAFKEFVWRFVNVIARTMNSLGDRISYVELYRTAGAPGKLAIRYFETLLNAQKPGWGGEFEEPFMLAQQKKEEGMVDDPLTAQLRQAVAAARQTKRELRALALAEYLNYAEVQDDIANSLSTMMTNDRSYFDKLVSSLYPLLEKLTTGRVAELISPNYEDPHDKRPIFTWADIINQGGVAYIGLDSLSDYEVGGVVGNGMFADLTSLAGKGYKYGFSFGQSADGQKRRVSIHADEFNELIGDEFIPMLNKAGGAGFEVTAYTQTWSDVEAKIGSKAKAEQIRGNFNTLIMLRVKATSTAEMLTEQLPEITVPSKVLASSATDSVAPGFESFGSRNEDRLQVERRPMLTPADMTSLPKGQAFALIEGGQLVKLRFPMPDPSADGDVPDDIRDLAHSLEQTYAQKYLAGLSGDEQIDGLDEAHVVINAAIDPLDLAISKASK